jgi:thiol-disulfide isomerase/thioredoxin
LLLTRSLEIFGESKWTAESIFSHDEWLNDNAEGQAAALYSLAELREREGLGRDALPLLERIVNDFPQFADAETLRALVAIQLRMRDFDAVRATFELLALEVELKPEELETWREHYEGEQSFLAHLAELGAKARKDAWAGFEKHALNWDAPAAIFTDMNGEPLNLATLTGKVVLLDFWASWCGPCKLALPGIDKMTPEFVETGDFVVIPANTWERSEGEVRKQTAKATWQSLGLSMPIYFDKERGESNPVVEAFGVSGIPTSFLIGKDGKILFKTIGYNGEAGELELKSKIEWALEK